MKPNDISRLFSDAFGEGSTQQDSASGAGRIVSPNERGKLFSDAFRSRGEMPKPNFSGWSLSPKGARGLSFAEKMELQQYWDDRVRYSELPQWIRESGAVVPSKEEKRAQDKLTTESGLDLNQRQQAFSVMSADMAALADMTTRETLRDSSVLDSEFDYYVERYGIDNVSESLAELNPDAAQYFHARRKVLAAEKKAVEQSGFSEEQTRKDIAEAQLKLAALNAEQQGAATDELLRQMDVRRNLENAEASE